MKIELAAPVALAALLAMGQSVLLPDSQLAWGDDVDDIEQGRELAFDRKKGNCLSCHAIADGSLPGNQGPPLVAMKKRYPDIDGLKAQIFNPLETNPNSMMPPFGLHNVLSEEDIAKIAAYLYTL